MATADLWLGWRLLMAPGPGSALPVYQSSETSFELPPPPSSSKGLVGGPYPWEGTNPTKGGENPLNSPPSPQR